jgi:hypothetical protein
MICKLSLANSKKVLIFVYESHRRESNVSKLENLFQRRNSAVSYFEQMQEEIEEGNQSASVTQTDKSRKKKNRRSSRKVSAELSVQQEEIEEAEHVVLPSVTTESEMTTAVQSQHMSKKEPVLAEISHDKHSNHERILTEALIKTLDVAALSGKTNVGSEETLQRPEISVPQYQGSDFQPEPIIAEDISIYSNSLNRDESTVIEKEFTSETVSDTVSWDFLKQIEEVRRQRRKTKSFGDDATDPSDTTIMEALFKLTKMLRYGKVGEKCEASKKIVYLYQTFKQDFAPHMIFDLFIKAHLDVIKDESWKVRTQVCYSLKGKARKALPFEIY